jgi:hypothetical protein
VKKCSGGNAKRVVTVTFVTEDFARVSMAALHTARGLASSVVYGNLTNINRKAILRIVLVALVATVLICAPHRSDADQPCGSIGGHPMTETIIDDNTHVVVCVAETNLGEIDSYVEWRGNKIIAEARLFNTNQGFSYWLQFGKNVCKPPMCRFKSESETWLNQYGKKISTVVYIFYDKDPIRSPDGETVTELHQIFRKFGQGAILINPDEILKTGVVP